MSISTHRDLILNAILSALAQPLDPSGKTYQKKNTEGAAFATTHRAGPGEAVSLFVRRSPDLDAFTRIAIDWYNPDNDTADVWLVDVWDTSNDPKRYLTTRYSFARPSQGIAEVCAAVRKLASEYLNPEGGVKNVTDADLEALIASGVVGGVRGGEA